MWQPVGCEVAHYIFFPCCLRFPIVQCTDTHLLCHQSWYGILMDGPYWPAVRVIGPQSGSELVYFLSSGGACTPRWTAAPLPLTSGEAADGEVIVFLGPRAALANSRCLDLSRTQSSGKGDLLVWPLCSAFFRVCARACVLVHVIFACYCNPTDKYNSHPVACARARVCVCVCFTPRHNLR